MSGGASYCDQRVDFVESAADGRLITVVQGATVEDAVVLHSNAASSENNAVVNQALSNSPRNSAAEAFISGSTAVTTMSVERENDSLPVSTNHLEKQNVIVCKLVRNNGRCF